jgi:hypothetical protein
MKQQYGLQVSETELEIITNSSRDYLCTQLREIIEDIQCAVVDSEHIQQQLADAMATFSLLQQCENALHKDGED